MISKFPANFCGIWYLMTSTNNIIPPSSSVKIDYNNIELITTYKFGPIKIDKKSNGLLSRINMENNTARLIWNKERLFVADTYIFPPIEIPIIRKKYKGQRIKFNINDDERWIDIYSRKHEYLFRKISIDTNNPDFPAFHKMLFTQIVLTDLINKIDPFKDRHHY